LPEVQAEEKDADEGGNGKGDKQNERESSMSTWAIWTYGLLIFSVVSKLLAMGTLNYPRTATLLADSVDVLILMAWIIWGTLAIWGN
jgi:hypothetical protein